MLTLAGFGIIDNNGHILHGVGASAIGAVSGSATLSYQGNPSHNPNSMSVTTESGVTPTVQIDSTYPAKQFSDLSGTPIVTNLPECTVAVTALSSGSFTVTNQNAVISKHTASEPYSVTFAYRWL
jgi:hypothetical protein